VDGTSRFGNLIRKYLEPQHQILDLGAGSGKSGPVNFQHEVRTVIGLDRDSYIRENTRIDHRMIGVGEHLPFRADRFDLVLSDWMMEHLVRPELVVHEVYRVLKPGGLFAFRTGNIRHYSYAVAAATPYWFHRLVANRVRGLPQDNGDPHPTYYRINTQKAVRRCMSEAGFLEHSIAMVEPEPSYMMFSVPSFLLGLSYERLVNQTEFLSSFRACILACFRKPS
jgi:ubiquinone/menaquinone biosynthesis C-methylase UbiE